MEILPYTKFLFHYNKNCTPFQLQIFLPDANLVIDEATLLSVGSTCIIRDIESTHGGNEEMNQA